MIIGLDIDNTIAKYTKGLVNSIAEQLNVTDHEAHQLAYGDPVDYAMSNWPGFPEAFHNFHTTAVENGLYRNLEVIERASEFLWKLSDEGHHIRIITSRFVQHGQNSKVVRDTGIWLDDNKIPYRDIMFTNMKADIHCDVYVDDSPKNIEILNAAGKEVIIFDASYNLEIPGKHAADWKTAYKLIQELSSSSN